MSDQEELAAYRRMAELEDKAKVGVASPKPVDTELTWAEKNIAPLLPKFLEGNLRGSAVGRVMQGMADPGVAIAQLGANAIGQGDPVNKSIADTEAKYQAARAQAGSTGFDPARMLGNVAITAPAAGLGGAAESMAGLIGKGALTGAGFGAAEPVTNGGDSFWLDKVKQAGLGAVAGGLTAPLVAGVSRLISPNASVNPKLQLLRDEGVQPSIGQALGGAWNKAEEKIQNTVPFLGDAIANMRGRGAGQLESAAFARGGDPIGASIRETGNSGVTELKNALGQSYENVIPKLSVDALDPTFIGKVSSLRTMAQSLPPQEARQFDAILSREFDSRIAPNGMLSGQNLKDAWNGLRDTASQYSKSNDAYQSQLGQAIKQTFQELKDHVNATNPADVVAQLKNTDLGYANFKRIQRAAGSVAADEGNFSPAQLHNAVKALDNSKDKARFSEGDALMQDLSAAGKSMLSNKVPDSGTAGRMILGSLLGGGSFVAPHITIPTAAAIGAGSLAYTPAIQNALVALLANRPNAAPQVANYLRRMTPAITAATTPALIQSRQK